MTARVGFAAVIVALVLLSFVGRTNYLLFHVTVESFSIIVTAGIFVIAWNTRGISGSRYLLVLGVSHLFVAIVTLLHTFSYKGMGVFPGASTNLPTQLWIATRALESLAFLVAGISLRRRVPVAAVFVSFGALTLLALGSIWVVPVFPVMHVEGQGLTAAKIAAEYAIMAVFAASGVLLWRDRKQFEPRVATMLLAAIATMIAAELAFTLYVDVYGLLNFIGHYLIIISFILVYRALILTALREPYSLLFREITRREEYEHRLADTLQSAILSGPDHIGGVVVDHAHASATEAVRVGGDFWDLFSPESGKVAFVMGDICGKGIDAVASNVMVRVTLRTFAYENHDPAEVLRRTNEVISPQLADDRFATVLYGVLDVRSGRVEIACAGHPRPVLCSAGTATSVDIPCGPPLGVMTDEDVLTAEIHLPRNGALVLYSDGLIDAGWRSEMYGVDRLLRALESHCGDGSLAQALLDEAVAHAGGTVDDDVAVLVLRLSPVGVTAQTGGDR